MAGVPWTAASVAALVAEVGLLVYPRHMLRNSPVLLLSIVLIFLGGACQRASSPNDPDRAPAASPEEERADHELAPASPPKEPAGAPGEAGYEPASRGDRITIEPEEPRAGESIEVRAGPLTFRNGCEGIERSWAEGPDEDGRIFLRWAPRPIPPDAFCTMALHSQWIEVEIDGLEPGEYVIVAPEIGEEPFSVRPARE